MASNLPIEVVDLGDRGLTGLSAYEEYQVAYLAAHNGDATGMPSRADFFATAGGNLQPQIDVAQAAADRSAKATLAVFSGSAITTGGPSVAATVNNDGTEQAQPVDRRVWINPEPVPQDGILQSISLFVRLAGPVAFGFVNDAGDVMATIPLTLSALGAQTFATGPIVINKGWRFGQLHNGYDFSGLIGYSAYGYALNAPAIANNAPNVGALAVVGNVTIAASYTLNGKAA